MSQTSTSAERRPGGHLNDFPLFELRDVSKFYPTPDQDVVVLQEFSAAIPGELTAIVGASGCGKTTMMNLLGGLDHPTRGEILHRGHRIPFGDERALRRYRQSVVGWVFQESHLIGHQTLLENAALSLLMRGAARQSALEQAAYWLRKLGIDEALFGRKPAAVSGGQRQRCAIARAFTAPSEVILADEPTGSLDPENAECVMSVLASAARDAGRPVVLVSHNHDLAHRHADQVLRCTRYGLVSNPG